MIFKKLEQRHKRLSLKSGFSNQVPQGIQSRLVLMAQSQLQGRGSLQVCFILSIYIQGYFCTSPLSKIWGSLFF